MYFSEVSRELYNIYQRLEGAKPYLTFFGGWCTSNGEGLLQLADKVHSCAQNWKKFNNDDRLRGIRALHKIKRLCEQIEGDIPKRNRFTQIFAFARMHEFHLVGVGLGIGKYICPHFFNVIEHFKWSLNYRIEQNFCAFTRYQLQTSFPDLWEAWRNGDRSRISEQRSLPELRQEDVYYLEPDWLLKELESPKKLY